MISYYCCWFADDGREYPLKEEIERKEIGLEWMLKPAFKTDKKPLEPVEQVEEPHTEEVWYLSN